MKIYEICILTTIIHILVGFWTVGLFVYPLFQEPLIYTLSKFAMNLPSCLVTLE
jgi:hypothetical protein